MSRNVSLILKFLAVACFLALGAQTAQADTPTGGAMVGTVVDTQGQALSGVEVRVYRVGDDPWIYTSATTDGSGVYATATLAPGEYLVNFVPSDVYVEEWFGDKPARYAAEPITILSGDRYAEATLVRKAKVSGIVTDAGNGNPLDAFVSLNDVDTGQVLGVQANENNGAYSLYVPPGTYSVEFNPGYVGLNLLREWWTNSHYPNDAQLLTVTEGQLVTDIDAALEQAGTISGRVTDAQANAVSGLRVEVHGPSVTSTWTDGNGDYAISNLLPGEYRIKFRKTTTLGAQWYDGASTRSRATPVTVGVSQNITGIDATMYPPRTMGGQIRDQLDHPIAGVQVEVYKAGATRMVAAASTDGNGAFLTRALPEGDYQVQLVPAPNGSVVAPQWYQSSPSQQRATVITLTDGTSANIEDQLSLGGSISGTVTDTEGSPVWNARVTAVRGGLAFYTYTATDGSYTITGLPSGTFDVGFDRYSDSPYIDQWYDRVDGYQDATGVDVIRDENTPDVDAELKQTGAISGTVTSGGNPVSTRLMAYQDGLLIAEVFSDGQGSYTFPALPPGSYRVYAEGTNTAGAQWWNGEQSPASADTVEVTSGQTVTAIDFALGLKASIAGILEDPNGTPAASGYVSLYKEGREDPVGGTQISNDGTYLIEGLDPGDYLVLFGAVQSVPKQWWEVALSRLDATPVTLTAGQRKILDVMLPMPTEVRGQVTDGQDKAVTADVSLYLPTQDVPVQTVRTGAAGTYVFTTVAPGPYEIRFDPVDPGLATQWWDGAARRSTATTADVTADAPFIADAQILAGGTLSGVVTDEQGEPVGGAKVFAYSTAYEAVETVTDDQGGYTLMGLDEADYRIYVEPGSAHLELIGTWYDNALEYDYATPVTVDNGQSVVRDVVVQAGATISGRVTDLQGQPVEGIGVDMFGEYGKKSLTAWTDSDGRYRSSGLPPGTYLVRFMPGYYGGDGLVEQWWDGARKAAGSEPVTLATKEQLAGIDAALRPLKGGTTAPSAPRDLKAVAGNGKVTLTWDRPFDNGGLAITRYTAKGTPGGECETLGERTCVIEGLTNGTSYTFTVRAANSAGLSPESQASAPVIPVAVPDAPADVQATAGIRNATVSWTASTDNGSPVTGYTVMSKPGGMTCTASATTCEVPGLTAGTSYTFTVTAANELGSSAPSKPSNAVTPRGAAGSKTQKPGNPAAQPPKRVKISGVTVLTGRNARTNAGQPIRTRVRVNTAGAQGEIRYYRLIRGPQGKVAMRTFGYRGLKIVVLQRAAAQDGYRPYLKRTVYIDGVRR